jgi:hypothetical protein
MKEKILKIFGKLFVIIIMLNLSGCSSEEDHCIEYYYEDTELVNECEVGVCTRIIQEITTCISYEGK